MGLFNWNGRGEMKSSARNADMLQTEPVLNRSSSIVFRELLTKGDYDAITTPSSKQKKNWKAWNGKNELNYIMICWPLCWCYSVIIKLIKLTAKYFVKSSI